jgi:hypothetical protein
MPDYTGFFLNSKRNVIAFETLEISHPNFSQTFYLVRNKRPTLSATLEGDEDPTVFQFVPMRLRLPEKSRPLDQSIEIQLGDLGEILPAEIDAVKAADAMQTRPLLKYRAFRSDDLSAPMRGPITLAIHDVTRNREGAVIVARANRLNVNRTGETYDPERFDMLRAYQ